ncbi:acyl-CoA dehydrogenase family protein [Caldilinea sp.]|uniref:acyl-CoA dehydrogenase family protein n=1 Tax=Caldilinea sp. TaxID=2293560 RepID=UPI002C532D75|nr:acyl-CoA dehydrogenase family protein [Caldilinea sp.]HRA68654.1 acyl-CoA dehydrogenase family protein [Caldilinea sp.]
MMRNSIDYPTTERQARLIAVADRLAVVFATRAGEQDRSGAFPYANFADIRTAGLHAAPVPAEYGGWGADLLETVMMAEHLARGDGSTALSFVMHLQTIGSAVENGDWPPDLLAELCRAAVARGALVNSLATEPALGSPSRGGLPQTTARPCGAGDGAPDTWMIDGCKSFASMFPVLDYAVIPAALEDGSGEVGRFLVAVDDRFQVDWAWDASGMRTTGSHTITLRGVETPHTTLIGRSGQARGGVGNAWFTLGISAVYLGVAAAAIDAAGEYACNRVPTALGRPIAELEGVQRRLGQAALLLHTARAQLYYTAEQWLHYPARRTELTAWLAAAKVTVTNHAVEAVDHCLRVAGGAGLSRTLPLERYHRDVRAGLSHPPSDDEAAVAFGRAVVQRFRDNTPTDAEKEQI